MILVPITCAFAVLSGFGFLAALQGGKNGIAAAFASCVFALVFLNAAAAYNLNRGEVSSTADPYAEYLDTDTVYHVRSIANAGYDHIVLVQAADKNDFKVIRVSGSLPPSKFVLVGGKPIGVAADSSASVNSWMDTSIVVTAP